MSIRFLINEDGVPFEPSEIGALRNALDSLGDNEREKHRNQNASAIAQHNAVKFLIVSGPGTGKSHLFMDKIGHWYQNDQNASVFITSFVRKLVADLQNDIKRNIKLTDDQKNKITIFTLHKFARSIVEKNHGTSEWLFRPHFQIIGQSWKNIVWDDVLAFYPETGRSYTWERLAEQLHDNNFDESDGWKEIKETYFKLCQFYNAAGFADLILRATKALTENPDINKDNYFIIDEYQDFNHSEDALIHQLVINNPKGLLVVGDDEQILYEKLKSAKPTLIRNLYKNKDYIKGMLPFCGRSSFHITKTADHFIRQHRDAESIEKIYLPLKTNTDDLKVQIIACATPQTAVDYIEKFVADNKAEIERRKADLNVGKEKDAYLLILTPDKKVKFYFQKENGKRRHKEFDGKRKLDELVSEYQAETRTFSEDYYRLLNYYSLANNPHNNFTFRKVLHYERLSEDKVHELIATAIQSNRNFCELDFQEIKDVLCKCNRIKIVLDSEENATEKLDQITGIILVADKEKLQAELERKAINQRGVETLEHQEEEEAELEEIEVKKMNAVELMTIVGSKGLSADHIIIIGFDNVHMRYVSKNAFYVAMTRARKSLRILTALKSGGATGVNDFLNQLPDDHLEFYKYTKKNQSKSLCNRQCFIEYLRNLGINR